jgi:uncharacterized protein YecE (DUF72 family)
MLHRSRLMGTGRIHVGCSGWHYRHWAGRVYPRDVPARAWLGEYARRFDTVELNNSFYRLPEAEQFARWRDQVASGFLFAVKASRYLTHFKRLIDPEEPLDRLFSRARHLGRALGPILYQLPPGWVPDNDRFQHFLQRLPRKARGVAGPLAHAIEFRDPRGYSPEIIALLEEHDVALCVHDMPGSETPRLKVGPFVYLRLHGSGAKYGGSYPSEHLRQWAEWIDAGSRAGKDAYVYFNNDREGYAVQNAETLRELLIRGSNRVSRSTRA